MLKGILFYIIKLYPVICLLLIVACNKENTPITPDRPSPPVNISNAILTQLSENYTQLPEQAISISRDNSVYTQYTNPTERYNHRVMGDGVEGGALVVVVDSVFYEIELADNYVFEDVRPRLFDVDQDGQLEIITIRTETTQGAGIMIYKIINNQLEEYAYVPEIGQSNRWLNIVSINDLDEDGVVELAWIQTPHIGGILKVAKIQAGELTVLDELSEYSNHGYGDRNLCLSVLTEDNQEKIFYVPTQDRTQIIGFKYQNDALEIVSEIDQLVDFSNPLSEQYDFLNPISIEDNCIFVE